MKVLVDASFLINSPRNSKRLFDLIDYYQQLDVTILSEYLERACQSKGIKFKDFVDTFPNVSNNRI